MIEYRDWINRADLLAEPDKIFVFGDNAERWGLGGQAKEMRGEPNAFGIATLYAPGKPYDGNDRKAIKIVCDDLAALALYLRQGKIIVTPSAGVGTGLADLRNAAPDIHQLIRAFFTAAGNRPCPWE